MTGRGGGLSMNRMGIHFVTAAGVGHLFRPKSDAVHGRRKTLVWRQSHQNHLYVMKINKKDSLN